MTSNIWTESECGADFLAQKLGAGVSCLHCLMVNPPLNTEIIQRVSMQTTSLLLMMFRVTAESLNSTSACFARVSVRTAPAAERDQNGTFMVWHFHVTDHDPTALWSCHSGWYSWLPAWRSPVRAECGDASCLSVMHKLRPYGTSHASVSRPALVACRGRIHFRLAVLVFRLSSQYGAPVPCSPALKWWSESAVV